MSWIPFGYIFETDILEKLINNFYVVPSFRNDTLPCLVEVASLKISPDDPKCDEYTEKQFLLFITFVSKTVEVTKDRNLTEEYSRISEGQRPYFEIFCLQTGLFLSEFINNQIEKIEQLTSFNEVPSEFSENLAGAVGKGLDYLIQLSNIELSELFKTMMEFWHKFTYYILVATKGRDMFSKTGDTTLINLQNNKLVVNPTLRQDIIPNYLEKLCITMIRTMAKPEEVLVVIDENGNPVEELITDTETVSLYDTMRENLVFLTNIDSKKVYTIITSSLDNLLANEANFSFDALNKICWALGSISECMMEEEENKFVVTVIKELLNLVDKKKGKDNKALVAADIMYVVGQFPRFLCTHWAFLKTVIKKLNEFMAEKHPGVQDMATEVFLKISKKTKRMFVIKQGNEEPYICELIRNLPENTKDLEVKQSLHIYEGLGHMISEQKG